MSEMTRRNGGIAFPAQALVSTDGVTILGDGSETRPLHTGGAAILPLAIFGAAFVPNNLNSGTIANYGANGMAMDHLSSATGAVGPVTLPVGTPISRVAVRVIDSAGTTLIAHFADANLTFSEASALSDGSGTEQTLTMTFPPGFKTAPGNSYGISVDRVGGAGGWQVVDATVYGPADD